VAEKVLFTWSGGKDSSLALHELQQTGQAEIVALLTTLTEGYDRISMHGVRVDLLEQQAAALSLPLEKVYIPPGASNEQYEAEMTRRLTAHLERGVSTVAFGDIFLEDIRAYRESNLARVGMKAIFPIWKQDTTALAHRFIESGFRAIVTCVDTDVLDGAFAGRDYDEPFLADLPDDIDPCGENGEFHSFVHDGPNFASPVPCRKGDVVLRDNRFNYCDVLPV